MKHLADLIFLAGFFLVIATAVVKTWAALWSLVT